MNHLSYTVLLVPDVDRGGFTVTVPEIPEIVTEGDDEAQALAMAREAISLSLRYTAEKGLGLPIERAAPRLATVQVDAGAAVGAVPASAGREA